MATVDVTRIASNIGAMNALNSLQDINKKLATHQTRLATGKRINSASDDPAGLTIATKMMARSEGLKVAIDNIADAKNMLSVAEAGLSKITDILVQMRNKSEQAASDTLGSSERGAIQTQLGAYAAQIDDLVKETKWNGVQLLDGTVDKKFQTGVDEGEFTSWQLSQKHTADQLNVSDAYDTVGITAGTFSGSISLTGAGTAGANAAIGTQVATGNYSFEILGKADAAGALGSVDVDGELLASTTAMTAVAPGAGELASGHYRVTVTNVTDATNQDYTIRNLDTGTQTNVAAEDLTAAAGVLSTTGGSSSGVALTMAAGKTGADLQVGDTVDFEYIAKGQVKIALKDASGQALSIDRDGSGVGTKVNNYAYTAAGASFDTGRGLTATIAAMAAVVTGNNATFNFHESGSHVVDVSTADKAASYMTSVTNALDVVNNSMAKLGSLSARLGFKEEQVVSAQVNIESSYSRIMNANMAEEQVNASKFSILQQTATAMLAQANAAPQTLLSLFR